MNSLQPNVLARSHHRAQQAHMNRAIIVQCHNNLMMTGYARIGVGTSFVEVAFGNVENGLFVIPSTHHVSVLRLADHPELGDLHDGNGFNIMELASFVAGLEYVEELELS